jgi:predicted alpha-1,2-mannosidase
MLYYLEKELSQIMKKTLFMAAALLEYAVFAGGVVKYVDPFIGTSGNGHTTPAATRPFGMVQPGPDTGHNDWDHCSGYRFEETTLFGFSQTHLSGTGGGDLGDFQIKPFLAGDALAPQEIDKRSERAEPGFYTVTAGGVTTEITATRCAAVYRIKFSGQGVPKILFDNQWVNASNPVDPNTPRVEKAGVEFAADHTGFTAFRRVNRWVKGRDVYIALTFSVPWVGVERLADGPGEKGGRYVFSFPDNRRELEVRLALSRTSMRAAANNLAAETSGRSFGEIRADAKDEWNRLLSRVRAQGDEKTLKTLYTSLYHVFFSPNMISDAGEEPYYSNFSFWDTFRAAHPLYTLLVPERVPGMVDSILKDAHRRGIFPIWPLWGYETECMIGTHSIPVVVDAYLKGLLPDLDVEKTMQLMYRSQAWEHSRRKEGWPMLRRFGYLPADLVEHESVSRTLECAYDDACVARFAKAIGNKEMEKYFTERAGCWRNLFDPETRLMRPKKLDGGFVAPFDPFRQGYGSGYTEGNAWQYTWHVLHDPQGLIEICGGREAFVEHLDRLFRFPEDAAKKYNVRDVTGLIGQYAHGNEPSHHVPFFFALAGRPERTQELVREICGKFYSKVTPDGLCGNDDCGQMSAWYIFACLGMYPFDPCGGEYVRFEPLIPGIKIVLE